MVQTPTMTEEQTQVLKALGYEVHPSSTRPDAFQWRLKMVRAGQAFPPIERPDSFATEDLAWADAQAFQNERSSTTANPALYTADDKAEMFDELTARARALGYGNLLSAISSLERAVRREFPESTALPSAFTDALSSVLKPGADQRDCRPRGG